MKIITTTPSLYYIRLKITFSQIRKKNISVHFTHRTFILHANLLTLNTNTDSKGKRFYVCFKIMHANVRNIPWFFGFGVERMEIGEDGGGRKWFG